MGLPDPALRALEERLGVAFRDTDLLQRALVHRSYLNENPSTPLVSNERLEFLGDAVLGLAVAHWLYQEMPDASEGHLTRARAALVRRDALAEVAQGLGLGPCLLLGKGEESAGGRQRPANLANALEALVGALYLDQGEAAVQRFIQRLCAPVLARYRASQTPQDEKSLLQELLQGALKQTPLYRIVDAQGPDHERRFTVEVMLGDRSLARGVGRSKREAEQAAARQALERLREGQSVPSS